MQANICQLAIAKLLEKEIKGTRFAPGIVTVDETITLRVRAEIKKGQDVEYTPTVSIPLKATLALVLEKAGFSRDHATKLLTEAMTEALALGEKGEGAIQERLKDVDLALARVEKVTAALPKQTRTGPTTVKGSVEVVVPEIHFVIPQRAEVEVAPEVQTEAA